MKRDGFSEDRDGRAPGDGAPDRHLMCAAKGCPNRWSCDMGNGKLCTWHDRAPVHQWPQITQEQLEAETDRARAAAEPKPEPAKLSFAQKRELLERMRRVFGDLPNPHAWAHRLQAKRANGHTLSPAQRHCLEVFEQRHGIAASQEWAPSMAPDVVAP